MEDRYTRADLLRILSKIQGQPFNKRREDAIRALLAEMPEPEVPVSQPTPNIDLILQEFRASTGDK